MNNETKWHHSLSNRAWRILRNLTSRLGVDMDDAAAVGEMITDASILKQRGLGKVSLGEIRSALNIPSNPRIARKLHASACKPEVAIKALEQLVRDLYAMKDLHGQSFDGFQILGRMDKTETANSGYLMIEFFRSPSTR